MTDDSRWRDNPTISDPVWERKDVSWHDSGTLRDGTSVRKLGSLWYVVDDEGNAISEGYHEIWHSGGQLLGKCGAKTEPVVYRQTRQMIDSNTDDQHPDLARIKRAVRYREGEWEIAYAEDSVGRPTDVVAYRDLSEEDTTEDGYIEMLHVEDGDIVSGTYRRPWTEAEIQRQKTLEAISPGPPVGYVIRHAAREHRALLITVLLALVLAFLVALLVGGVL